MNSRLSYLGISRNSIRTLLMANIINIQNSFKQFFSSMILPEYDKHYSNLQIVFYIFVILPFSKICKMKSFLLARYCLIDLGLHSWSLKSQIHWSKQRSLLAHHNKYIHRSDKLSWVWFSTVFKTSSSLIDNMGIAR